MKNLILFIAILFSSLCCAQKTDSPVKVQMAGLQVGDIVPEFTLKNIDESMISVEGLEGKGAIVIFSCNHCPYVVASEDRMIDLHNTYEPKGYPVVAINPNDINRVPGDSFEAMQIRSKEKGFPFYYLRDETQEIAKLFGATRTPHVYLLAKTEKGMQIKYIGAIDDSTQEAEEVEEKFLENAIAAVEKGLTPDPSFTKAVGCTIKWAE